MYHLCDCYFSKIVAQFFHFTVVTFYIMNFFPFNYVKVNFILYCSFLLTYLVKRKEIFAYSYSGVNPE